MSSPDHSELLRDILAEQTAGEFRSAVLDDTLRHARYRRWREKTRHAAVTITGVMIVLSTCILSRPRAGHSERLAGACSIIGTRPLSVDRIVETRPFDQVIAVSNSIVAIVNTVPTSQLAILSDAELLALAPTPAALVRTGPDSQHLLFLPPAPPN